jgi:mannose-6-phosphate isomerase-like protein (cupin superfamily)
MSSQSRGSGGVVLMLDNVVKIAVSAEDVGGAYCVVDVTAPAGGGSPVLHTHPPAECFYCLAGSLTVYREAADGTLDELELTSGRAAFVPGGVAHTYRNQGVVAARFIVVSEGDVMERFFRNAGVPVDDPDNVPAIDPERIPEAVARARAAGEALGFTFRGPVVAGAAS